MVNIKLPFFASLAVVGFVLANNDNDKYNDDPRCSYPDDDCCMQHAWIDHDNPGWMQEGSERIMTDPFRSDAEKIYPDLPEDQVLFSLMFKPKHNEIIFIRPEWHDKTTNITYPEERLNIGVDCGNEAARYEMQCIQVPTEQPKDPAINPHLIDTIELHPGNWCPVKPYMWNYGWRFDNLWARYKGHFRNLQDHRACIVWDDRSPKPAGHAYLVGKMGMFCEFRNADVGVEPNASRRITEKMMRDVGLWVGL